MVLEAQTFAVNDAHENHVDSEHFEPNLTLGSRGTSGVIEVFPMSSFNDPEQP